MIRELSDYKLIAATIDWEPLNVPQKLQAILDFWKTAHRVPSWQRFAHLCYLLQPSSACVERAFSLLKYIYGEQQKTSKQDIIESTLMLRYNRSSAFKRDE